MPNLLIQIGDEVREMNEQELAQRELDEAAAVVIANALAAKDAKRQQVLAKLGLTADEAAALLG
jgi:hypothetical protein